MSITKNAFSVSAPGKWVQLATKPVDSFKPVNLRKWQEECYFKLRDVDYFRLNCPTAAGKTMELIAIANYRLVQDPDLRVVFATPQTMIGNGFTECRSFTLPNEGAVSWVIPHSHNFCARHATKAVVDRLLRFLRSTEKPAVNNRLGVMERAVVCTHSALLAAFRRDRKAFKKLLIVVDEAHHARCSEQDDKVIGNQLGSLIHHGIGTRKFQIGLCTATFFRPDQTSIIPRGCLKDFVPFEIDMIRFLKEIRPFDQFKYDFVLYDGLWVKELTHLLAEGKKTIVYVPHPVSTASSGKRVDWERVYEAIAGCPNPEIKDKFEPIIRIKRVDGKWVKVVNLVDPSCRETKKEAVLKRSKDRDAIDVIIALGMFHEGSDWTHAERVVMIGPRTSLTDVQQIMGRIFRKADPHKNTVDVYHLLAHKVGTADDSEVREELNNFIKAVFAVMLLEDAINPVKFTALQAQQLGLRRFSAEGGSVDLANYFGGVGQAISFNQDLIMELIRWDACNPDSPANNLETFGIVVHQVFEDGDYGMVARREIDDIVKIAWWQHQRRNLKVPAKVQGRDVSKWPVELLQTATGHPLEWFKAFTTGTFGTTDWAGVRDRLIGVQFRPFKEARGFVHGLKLPNKRSWFKWVESGNKPKDIPVDPRHYTEFKNWCDWLGVESRGKAVDKKPYKKAREFARSLKFRYGCEWLKWAKTGDRPMDIPFDPRTAYKGQFKGWNDWLGSNAKKIATKDRRRSFSLARKFVRSLGFGKSQSLSEARKKYAKWSSSGRRPDDISSLPLAYGEEFRGWSDFLGYSPKKRRNAHGKEYRSFQGSRRFARGLKLKSGGSWIKFASSTKRPVDIPFNPIKAYPNEWKGWPDFLGYREHEARINQWG